MVRLLLTVLVMFTFTACGGSGGTTNTSVPSGITQVTIGLGQTVMTGALATVGTVPQNIQSMSVTAYNVAGQVVAGPAFANAPTLTVALNVPNGNSIRFVILAFDAANGGGNQVYHGESIANLNGGTVTLPVKMNLSVAINPNVLSVQRGQVLRLTGTVSAAVPPTTSPLLWTATAGQLLVVNALGSAADWTAPAVPGIITINAKIDPAVNVSQDPAFFGSSTITVLNQSPVAVDDYAATQGTAAITISPLVNDSDPEGDAINIAGVTQGALGSVVANANATLTYTANAGVVGNDTFTYTIRDLYGARATATIFVTLNDTVPPSIITPTPITVEATSAAGVTISHTAIQSFLAAAVATDNVGVVSSGNNAAALFPLGATIVSFTAADLAGNQTVVTSTVTVVDTTPPLFTAGSLADIYVEATGVTTPYAFITPAATDAYGVASIVTNNAGPFAVGATLVTWTATDNAGNTSTLTQNVVITDKIAPIITLTGGDPYTIEVGQTYADAGANAYDIVDGYAAVTGVATVTTTAPATFTITYDKIDAAGNIAAQVTRTVNVVDTTAPVITATPLMDVYVEAAGASTPVTLTAPAATDAYGIASVIPDNNGPFPLGTTVITWTATDLAGLTSTMTQNMVITDKTAPAITLIGADPYTIEIGQTYVDAGATSYDIVDGYTAVTAAGTVSTTASGSFTLTYDNTDAAGNAAVQVTRTVNVVDTTAPVFTAVSLADIYVEATGVTTPYAFITPAVTDAYGVASVVPSNSGPFVVGTTVVTWTATDNAGNTATLTQNVVITDKTAPVITLIGSDPYTIEVGQTYVDAGANSYDLVDGYTAVTAVGTVSTTAPNTVVLTYDNTDTAGNAATLTTRTVNVVDTIAPVITGIPLADIYVEATGVNTPYTFITPSATDAYGIASVIPNATGPFLLGLTVVTWTATDLAGLTSTTTQNVVIRDTTAPTIALVSTDPYTIEVGQTYVDAGAIFSDAVDGTGAVAGVGTVTTTAPGTFTITYDYTDGAGNPATQLTRKVNVVDTTAPVITGTPLADIYVEATGVNTPYTFITSSATDAYGISSVAPNAIGPFPLGLTVVTWTATDLAGLTSTTTQNLIVQDTTVPTIALVSTDPYTIEVGQTYVDAGATFSDAVDGTGAVTGVGTVATTAPGTFTITYDYTDGAGNPATQITRTVNVVDTTAPVIAGTPLADLYMEATGVTTPYAMVAPTAVDTYGIVSVLADINGPFSVGTTVVTWTATDLSGLTGTATQNLIVQDTTAPTVTPPASMVVTATDAYGMAATDPYITTFLAGVAAIDLVDAAPAITNDAPVQFPIGTTTVTFTATDSYTNAGTTSATVDVYAQGGGVAAAGRAVSGSTILITDLYGQTATATSDSYGQFTFYAPLTPPCLIEVQRTGLPSLFSLSMQPGIMHATSLTTMVTAEVLGATNAAQIRSQFPLLAASITQTQLDASVANLWRVLGLDAFTQLGARHPILDGTFAADGSGMDAVMDGLMLVERDDNADTVLDLLLTSRGNNQGAVVRILSTINLIERDAYSYAISGSALLGDDVYGTPVTENDLFMPQNGALPRSMTLTNNPNTSLGFSREQLNRAIPQLLAGAEEAGVDLYANAALLGQYLEQALNNMRPPANTGEPYDAAFSGRILTNSGSVFAGKVDGNGLLIGFDPLFAANQIGGQVMGSNYPPQFTQPGEPYSWALPEDSYGSLLVQAHDPNPTDILSFDIYTAPTNGTASVDAGGFVHYQGNLNFNGSDAVTVRVSDPYGAAALLHLNIVVTPVNDAPVITTPTTPHALTLAEDGYANFSATATDVDGDPLTFSLQTPATSGTATVAAGGSISYAGNLNYNGPDSFTVRVVDPYGASATLNVNVTVTSVNDVPMITRNGAASVDVYVNTNYVDAGATASDVEDGSITGSIITNNPVNTATAATYTVSYNVSDSYGAAATQVIRTVNVINSIPPTVLAPADLYTSTTNPSGLVASDAAIQGFLTAATATAFNAVPLTPTNDAPTTFPIGTTLVTFSATDVYGSTGTATASVVLTLNQVAPVITSPIDPYVLTVAEDSYANFTATATDANGDPITWDIYSTAANGTASIDGNGNVSYIGNLNFNGSDLFTVRASDNYANTALLDVYVTVTPVNDPPVILSPSDNYTASNNLGSHTFIPVLANDVDGDTWSVQILSGPADGYAVVNGMNIDYYGAASIGTKQLTFNVVDSYGLPSSTLGQTVYLNVIGSLANPPIFTAPLNPHAASVVMNSTISFATTVSDADPGEVLTFDIYSTAANGSASVDSYGTVSYTPTTGYIGKDTFTVRVTDSARLYNLLVVNAAVVSGLQPPTDGRIDGVNTGASLDNFGDSNNNNRSIAVGDLNGDGYGDLIVGNDTAFLNGSNSGVISIFYGTAAGVPHVSSANANVTLIGNAGSSFGQTVASGGDLTGDGIDDLVVAAPYDVYQQPQMGVVFIFSGASLLDGYAATLATATFTSDSYGYTYFGKDLALGDLTGDGYSDLVIGAPFADGYAGIDSGMAWVITGNPLPANGYASVRALHTYEGATAGDQLGSAVAIAGDVNGDGYADLITGSPGNSNLTLLSRGAAFLFYGPVTAGNSTDANASSGILGDNAYDSFGSFVAGAGDVNGDGFTDMIVGANSASDSYGAAGAAYLFTGSPTFTGGIASTFAWSRIYGEMSGDAFGEAVAGAGDVNGDGFDDYIVGAPWNWPGGAVYLFHGGTAINMKATAAAQVRYGPDLSAQIAYAGLGGSVAMGDFNGDSYSDFVAGGNMSGEFSLPGMVQMVYGSNVLDSDKDGISDADEAILGTDPFIADTDGDGLLDGAEVNTYGTDPSLADTDGDGFSDGAEVAYGSDPLNAASIIGNVIPVAGLNQAGGALLFDGVDRLVVADHAALDVTSAATFEAWVNPTALHAINGGTIFAKENAYLISLDLNGSLQWAFNNTSPGYVWTNTGYTLPLNAWSHVAVSYNGSFVNTYVNGLPVHTSAVAGNIAVDTYSLWVGNREAATAPLSGRMDELRIWNIARTQAEIQIDMYSTLTGSEAGLNAYWSFNAPVDVYASDLTANALQGWVGGGVAVAVPTQVAADAFGLSNPGSASMQADAYATLWLGGTDANNDPLTGNIATLPSQGTLWQTQNGADPYVQITTPGTAVSDTYGRVIFIPAAGQTGKPYSTFDFTVSDPYATSPIATVNINVTGPMVIAATNGNISISGAICNSVWNTANSPYWVQSNVTISSGCRLQIDAYTIVKLDPTIQIRVLAGGVLDIYGGSTSPVYFTSIKDDTLGGDVNKDGATTLPAVGDWQNIYYEANAGGTIQYADIRYAGSSAPWGGLYLASSINVNGLKVSNAAGHSLVIDGSAAPTITNSRFDGSTGEAIYLTSTNNGILLDSTNVISNAPAAYLSEQGTPVGVAATIGTGVPVVQATGRLEVGMTLASLNAAQFTAWETQIGRPLRRVQRMYNLDEPAWLWTTEVPNMMNLGFKLMLTLEPKLNSDIYANSPSRLKDIVAGTYDAAIDLSINGIINNVLPVYPNADIWIRIGQEMNGDWYPWGGLLDAYGNPHNGNAAGDYIAAFQHIVQRYRAAGLSENMVKFVWSPNVAPTNDFTMFYPGDSYADYIGMAGFNFGPNTVLHPTLVWQSFNTIFNFTYNTLISTYPFKQVTIGGISSAESGGSKATWVTDMATQLKNGYPSIVSIFWFNVDKTNIGETDWRIDSSATSLTAVQQMYLDNTLWR